MALHDEITQLIEGGVRDRVYPGAVWGFGDAEGILAASSGGQA